MSEVIISNIRVGNNNPPFIIAEMSGNHNQSLDRALKIVEAAAYAGAHAVKLQTYTADTMTLDIESEDFFISDPNSLWSGKSLYSLYKQAYTPWEWHKPIIDKCKKLGLICFSTPFDESAVDFLETLDIPCYKIASFENNHMPLIKKVASTGKPLIISTGLANITNIYELVETVKNSGCKDLILLKCTSAYPANAKDANLLTIPHMKQLFDCQVGLSDHTLGIGVSVASVVLGATVIEKHFTLSRADGGVDADFSLEPEEFKQLTIEVERAWHALGKVSYALGSDEAKSLVFKRSIYISRDIKAGEIFTKENIKIVRPGFGLPPKYFDAIIGKKASVDLKRGTAVKWELIL